MHEIKGIRGILGKILESQKLFLLNISLGDHNNVSDNLVEERFSERHVPVNFAPSLRRKIALRLEFKRFTADNNDRKWTERYGGRAVCKTSFLARFIALG